MRLSSANSANQSARTATANCDKKKKTVGSQKTSDENNKIGRLPKVPTRLFSVRSSNADSKQTDLYDKLREFRTNLDNNEALNKNEAFKNYKEAFITLINDIETKPTEEIEDREWSKMLGQFQREDEFKEPSKVISEINKIEIQLAYAKKSLSEKDRKDVKGKRLAQESVSQIEERLYSELKVWESKVKPQGQVPETENPAIEAEIVQEEASPTAEQPATITIGRDNVKLSETNEANKYKLTWQGEGDDEGVIVEIKGENDFLITNANGTARNDPAADESIKQALLSSPLNLEFKPPELKSEAEIEAGKVATPEINLKDNQSYKDLEKELSNYLEIMTDTKLDPRDKKAALQSAIDCWGKQADISEATRTQVEQIVIAQTTIAEIERELLLKQEELNKLISERHTPIDAPDDNEKKVRQEIRNLSVALKEKELSLIHLVDVKGVDGNKLIENYLNELNLLEPSSSDISKLAERKKNVEAQKNSEITGLLSSIEEDFSIVTKLNQIVDRRENALKIAQAEFLKSLPGFVDNRIRFMNHHSLEAQGHRIEEILSELEYAKQYFTEIADTKSVSAVDKLLVSTRKGLTEILKEKGFNGLLDVFMEIQRAKTKAGEDNAELSQRITDEANARDITYDFLNDKLAAERQAGETLETKVDGAIDKANNRLDDLGRTTADEINKANRRIAGLQAEVKAKGNFNVKDIENLPQEHRETALKHLGGVNLMTAGLMAVGASVFTTAAAFFGLKPAIDRAVADATKASNTTATAEDPKKKKA